MKFSTLILLPSLLCAVSAQSGAKSFPNRHSKLSVAVNNNAQVNTYANAVFPAVSSTKQVAITGASLIATLGNRTVSGLINLTNKGSGQKIKIEYDSTSFTRKTIATYSGRSAFAAYTSANSNLTALETNNTTITPAGNQSGNTLASPSFAANTTTYTKNLILSDTVTFNNQNSPNAIFIIHVKGNLSINGNTVFAMQDGSTSFANVYFQVDGTTQIGAGSFTPAQFITASTILVGPNVTTGIICARGAVTLGLSDSVNTLFDTDGDGVEDDMDDYPNQITKANNNYLSSQTLAFEDLWPSTGDFDMNDMVVSFDYNLITNAAGNVTEVIGNYQLLATGGSLHNGFGVQFPFKPSEITLCPSTTLFAKIGVQEANQDSAVVTFFSDMRKEMIDWNTLENATHISAPNLYTIAFRVTTPVSLANFNVSGFNPFIFRYNGTSRIEVHLPGHQPTKLADNTLFGTKDDNSTKGTSTTYLSKVKNLPFAIMIPTDQATFQYPVETKDITSTYLHFGEWAKSNGLNYPDWFANPQPSADYSNKSNIYVTPAILTN